LLNKMIDATSAKANSGTAWWSVVSKRLTLPAGRWPEKAPIAPSAST